MKYIVKTEFIGKVTHDVLKIRTDKPKGYKFKPGQGTELTINKTGWMEVKRPFTFTSLPEDNYLEFTIKIYPLHKGFTNELLQLKAGDELIINDAFG